MLRQWQVHGSLPMRKHLLVRLVLSKRRLYSTRHHLIEKHSQDQYQVNHQDHRNDWVWNWQHMRQRRRLSVGLLHRRKMFESLPMRKHLLVRLVLSKRRLYSTQLHLFEKHSQNQHQVNHQDHRNDWVWNWQHMRQRPRLSVGLLHRRKMFESLPMRKRLLEEFALPQRCACSWNWGRWWNQDDNGCSFRLRHWHNLLNGYRLSTWLL